MVIYEPKGKAREYAPLAVNLYRGCSHGCTYCYAPAATRTDRDEFHNRACPRRDVLRQLTTDAKRFRGDQRRILFSFTSDAYQPIETELGLTRRALEILAEQGLLVTVLTKGGLRAARDFPLLAAMGAEFAVTLTTDSDGESRAWEPNAALPAERIESLRQAKQHGLFTWVSFEPVINPEAVLRLIDATHEFVDLYKVGKLNHHAFAASINWPKFRREVVERLDQLGVPYLLKKDLVAAT